ncbi:MAG: ferrochelatase [Rhodospirillales bacterium]|nr:ferrochelatase [Rhodospirillales bacterium]
MKVAIVLFNLGGPDSPAAVRPFLRNLFNDPAIIAAPQPIRWLLAHWISFRRAPIARAIYEHLGGKSPLLELTNNQAQALEQRFAGSDEVRSFISMRYWHPMSEETVRAVKDFAPDRIILLPLYPQFSTTTTGSSLSNWREAAKRAGLDTPSVGICCYPDAPGFISAIADLLKGALGEAAKSGKPRVLFSAHGLPKKIVDSGDPYPNHVEITAKAVVDKLGDADLDWVVCYQSRVGPLQWIGPSTEDEIACAAKDGVPVVVVPIAFVSEHSETLVELDIEYRELALSLGITAYHRVATVSTNRLFVDSLKNIVDQALDSMKAGDKGETFTISCAVEPGACSLGSPQCPLKEKD